MEKYLRKQRRGKPIVEQKRNITYESTTEGKDTYDVMRARKSQHIGERVTMTDNR